MASSTTTPAETHPWADLDGGEGDTVTSVEDYAARVAEEYDRVNLGCGSDIRDGWLNVDIRDQPGVDFVWNLDDRPWPWPDNAFEEIALHNVLEHLDDHLAVLEELHRICQPGGTVTISGPHWNSPGAWIDPTHTRPFTRAMFKHELVRDKFWIRDERATCVRWGRLLPDRAALALADHISHGVSEIEVSLGVRSSSYLDNREEES